MNYSQAEIWLIIALMALGTYLIRFSFLGLIGDRPMPPLVLKLLRFTPVAVLPGMVAPLALFPDATGGQTEPVRLVAIIIVLVVSWWRKNALWGIVAGAVAFYAGLIATGQL
ncbi:AzlD domain-containing protein [Yoonia sp. R2331]|uniref:AzlD domain-containing protein n=1 Tax=Yoonia sp. R2331 TaxID=3237238 RepID=UPI0034E3C713